MFDAHFHERLPEDVEEVLASAGIETRRQVLVDRIRNNKISMDGIPIPTSLLPRVFPGSYRCVIEDTCRKATEQHFKWLSSQTDEDVLNGLKLNNALVRVGVLRNIPDVLTGVIRYDLAVVGEPSISNPPVFIELNALNYHGPAWNHRLPKAYLEAFPELSDLVDFHDVMSDFDANFSEIARNKKVLMVIEEDPEYEEYTTFANEMEARDFQVHVISDNEMKEAVKERRIKMYPDRAIYNGRHYDMLFLRTYDDTLGVNKNRSVLRNIVQSGVPIHDHPAVLLLEDKLRVAKPVTRRMMKMLKHNPGSHVLKRRIGSGGRGVYVGYSMTQVLSNINPAKWCIQDRYDFNTTETHPTDGDRNKAIIDLAAYFAYKWERGKGLTRGKLSGIMVRSSQTGYVVNLSSGGCFVPVFYKK
ncbi:MAG TPA: hypothetical protein VJG30_05010 [Candidatus Nanoarchaeia archaeon]|nr:hypothetical protein [Candidatus Nanoarchaeia archaeon]